MGRREREGEWRKRERKERETEWSDGSDVDVHRKTVKGSKVKTRMVGERERESGYRIKRPGFETSRTRSGSDKTAN